MPESATRSAGIVTDAMRALMGAKSEKRTAPWPLSEDSLRRFVQAVMEEDPVHWDPTAAEAGRYGSVVATPLFPLHVFRREPGTPDPLDAVSADPGNDGTSGAGGASGSLPPLDLPLKRLLNGGTEAEFFQLAKIGDVVTTQSEYVDISERLNRRGEPMVIVRTRTTYSNQDGATLATITTSLIAR